MVVTNKAQELEAETEISPPSYDDTFRADYAYDVGAGRGVTDLSVPTSIDRLQLQRALVRGRMPTIKAWIATCTGEHAHCIDMVITNAGDTALILACKHRHPDIVMHLLVHNANANEANFENETPLLFAAMRGMTTCVASLLACGARGHVVSGKEDMTPVWAAVQQGHDAIAGMIQSVAPSSATHRTTLTREYLQAHKFYIGQVPVSLPLYRKETLRLAPPALFEFLNKRRKGTQQGSAGELETLLSSSGTKPEDFFKVHRGHLYKAYDATGFPTQDFRGKPIKQVQLENVRKELAQVQAIYADLELRDKPATASVQLRPVPVQVWAQSSRPEAMASYIVPLYEEPSPGPSLPLITEK